MRLDLDAIEGDCVDAQSLAFVQAHDATDPHSDAVWGAVWTVNDTVISISADGSIKQFASTTGQPYPPNATFPTPHSLGLTCLSVTPDGNKALFNSLEGLTQLWDLSSGSIVGKYESYTRSGGEKEPAWSVSIHPNGERYASTGGSGNVTIHSAQPANFGEQLATLTASGRSRFGMHCAYSPDGKRIAMALETGQVYLFDVESRSLETAFTSHAMSVRSFTWSADSSLLLTASEDKHLVLHDVRSSGGTVASFSGHSSWVLAVDISPDNRLGLSGSADKTIRVWDIGARAAVSTIQDTGEVWAVSWRPKASGAGSVGGSGAFVSGGEDGAVRWWRGAGTSV
ncbi:hypothetical protein AX16_010063 [Volvariella volvacea WC 439]|nr:hypothetical protein AX16_010063 [Volvariella volvacea WC 439]